MQYYNGTDYDTLYPQTQYSNIIGNIDSGILPIVPINKGGTGQISANQAMGALINGCGINANIANGYVPYCLDGNNNGLRANISSFISYFQNNLDFSRVETISSRFTASSGTASFSVTGSFTPKLVVVVTATLERSGVAFFVAGSYSCVSDVNLTWVSGYISGTRCSISWTLGNTWNERDWNNKGATAVYIR